MNDLNCEEYSNSDQSRKTKMKIKQSKSNEQIHLSSNDSVSTNISEIKPNSELTIEYKKFTTLFGEVPKRKMTFGQNNPNRNSCENEMGEKQ